MIYISYSSKIVPTLNHINTIISTIDTPKPNTKVDLEILYDESYVIKLYIQYIAIHINKIVRL